MFKHSVRPFVVAVLLFLSLSYSISIFAASSSPKVIQLVEVSSIEKNTLTLSWLPTSDDNTGHEDLVYRVYLSKKADVQPDSATLKQEKTGAVSAVITGLKPATTYYVVVTATDEDGNVSWSNQLSGQTAAVNPKRTAVRVHELPSGQFAKSAQHYAIGDYLVSRENGGMLRKIDATSRSRQTMPTDHGSLNELFSELAFSSTIKLQDVPEQLTTTKQRQAAITANAQGSSVSWTDTGLTLGDSSVPQHTPSPRKSSLTLDGELQTLTGDYTRMNGPVSVGAEANVAKRWKADIYVPQTKAPNQELCRASLESFTHPDAGKNSLPKPTFSFERTQDSAGDYRQGKLFVDWTPLDQHVDLKGRPYIATLKVYVDDKGDDCNGDENFHTWAETLTMTVPVYVIKGTPNNAAKDKLISFQGAFNVNDTVNYDIRPELFIGASISGGRLQSADLKAVADLSFRNTLTITANGAATLKKRLPLAQKKFIKLFAAGAVPIIVSGTFKIDAEITGNVTGKATLEKLLELKFPNTEFGLQYRRNQQPHWSIVGHYQAAYTFQIKGEADASAEIKLTLIPDLQVSFYDAATGRLIAEPYVYAQAGLHGQFKYLDDNGAPLTDLDYWFEDLQAGAGADLKLYAGLSIFDYQIASYPKDTTVDQIGNFKAYTLLKKTPLAQLPKLTATVNDAPTLADNSESRLIYIQGKAKDYAAPIFKTELIQFNQWTPPTLLTTATGAELTASTRAGGYWFKYKNPGDYTVRLAGNNKIAGNADLGWFIRQIAETTITLTDDDHDGMVDQWEQRFGVTDPNADDDHDGVNNLAEFNSGYQPNNANSAPFTLTGAGGDKQVALKWTAVKGATGYSLCRATERIVDVNNCLNYAGGVWEDTNGTDFTVTGLVNGARYYFRVIAGNADTTLRVSNVLTATPGKETAYGLNDTGITRCSNGSQDNLSCPVGGYPNQDAQSGRDVKYNSSTDGHAGFSFTKISSAGAALAANATDWLCVKDNVTGLTWEVKTDDGGLHDKDWSYSWYEPDATKNGGLAGTQNNGSCRGTSACDTNAYIQAVNTAGWCGYNDWRLPTVDELSGIASLDRYPPAIDTIDTDYFPNTPSSGYWSSSPIAGVYSKYAWIVAFNYGGDGWGNKRNRYYVRLVRSGQ